MLSAVNLRELVQMDSTTAERLAMYVRGAAIVAATRRQSSIIVSTHGYTTDDARNATAILKAGTQFTEVMQRSYPEDIIEVAW